ncbi:helicase superfamily protein [Calothrix sp. NIES-4071]|nr:helicase superfamily protein [Calothrix sp. NIES-4071]BAZ57946.1 helicase superfamily protein [Calothrix sp. NIES-4105]
MTTITPIEHLLQSSVLKKPDDTDLHEKRGLNPKWTKRNVKRVTASEASCLLGYEVYSDGLWLQGYGNGFQFKPDKPRKDDKGRLAKYLSVANWDIMRPLSEEIENYWSDLELLKEACIKIDGEPYVIATEGMFKAIAGCSIGLPTFALPGVWQGLTSRDGNGNKYLLPEIKAIVDAGINILIAFDADAVTNPKVLEAELAFARAIVSSGGKVRTTLTLWNAEQGKGMDDFIKNNGGDAFKELAQKAALLNQLENALNIPTSKSNDDDKSKNKRVIVDDVVLELLETYKERFAYHQEHQTWREYNGKTWELMTIDDFEKIVLDDIHELGYKLGADAPLRSISKFLRLKLLVKKWTSLPSNKFIPFNDCVYDIDNAVMMEYKPEYRLLNSLPYSYSPLDRDEPLIQSLQKHCPHICNWLNYAMDDNALKIEKILAITNAIIKCDFSSLQMFVHLVGEPGAGKGTLIRLWKKMIGKSNYHESHLSALSDPYESSAFIDKMLLAFSDERSKVSIEPILKITSGSDGIRVRKMRTNPTFATFMGTVVMASNSNVFVGDTTGKNRRYCSVHFNKSIPKAKLNSKMEDKFDEELSALMSIALSMSSTRVVELIKGINDSEIPESKYQDWELTIQENSIAYFINECIIPCDNPNNLIRMGGAKMTDLSLIMPAYIDCCENANLKPNNLNTFKALFIRQCKELGYAVEACYNSDNQSSLKGNIQLRIPNSHKDVPTYSQRLLSELNSYKANELTNETKSPEPEPPNETKNPEPEPSKPEPPKQPSSNPTEVRGAAPPTTQQNNTQQSKQENKNSSNNQKINYGALVKPKDKNWNGQLFIVWAGNHNGWKCCPCTEEKITDYSQTTFQANQLTIVGWANFKF